MTHKNDGFIENLMKVPAPLNQLSRLLEFRESLNTKPRAKTEFYMITVFYMYSIDIFYKIKVFPKF